MPADAVFRVGHAHGMTADRGVFQEVAVKDGRIVAAEQSRDDLDSLIGPETLPLFTG
jgi:predicted amidohydrolase YtcJ